MEKSGIQEITSAFASPTFGKGGSFEVNKPVGSMSISPCGRDVVLASREGLHIIDLDSPYAPPRHLPHYTPWEVADVQWSPFPARDYWIVSTSNQKALVWNLALGNRKSFVEFYLHAHSRAITDINFSAHSPDILATCAVDSFVHCWDLRIPARPVLSFADWFGGATQVKWNRQDAHVIASSHDKFLRIWDDRKGPYPLRSTEAHSTKIYGLDWNRTHPHRLITCSLDKTIKFWDYSDERNVPERVINTPFPVWRARHTPFGWGVLAMPQRGDNNLYLYDRRAESEDGNTSSTSAKSFEGHEGQVKEFLWRSRGSIDDGVDNRDFELVSWGGDRKLRLHALDSETLRLVGHEKGSTVHKNYNWTRKNAVYKTFREDSTKLGAHSRNPSSSLLSSQGHSLSGFGDMTTPGITIRSRPRFADGWAKSGFLNTRPSLHSKSDSRRDLDPISWMKGVKIGKKEAPLEQSLQSITSPDYHTTNTWYEFESLGEEITHVGTKFTKVNFYEVDVNHRFLKLSLRGVLDPKESSTFLDCRVDFPESYPGESAPVLTIEETALLDKDILAKLQADIEKICEAYLQFRRSSLEAIIRYLQGDQTLEDALEGTKEEMHSRVGDVQDDEESSSDEDDELGGGYGENQVDELGLEGSGILSMANANAHVPLPKRCGAVWAGNGTLVCFFPPKAKEVTLVSSLGLQDHDELVKGKKRILEGFGKVGRPSKAPSLGTSTSNDSDSDSDSDSSPSDRSSSTSSNSSKDASFKHLRWTAQHVFDTDNLGLNIVDPERAVDATLFSVGSVSAAKATSTPSKSIISLHNLESLLPSKRELAEYSVSGENAASYNAAVALKHGYTDMAELWTILDMILPKKIPSEILPKRQSSDLNSIYRTATASFTARDNWGASADQSVRSYDTRPNEHFQWSGHPFGASALIKNLFTHFSQLGDIQMLAVMSCIFAQYPAVEPLKVSATLEPQIKPPLGTKEFPLRLITNTDQFSPPQAARSLLQSDGYHSAQSSPIKSPIKKLREAHSLSSSFGASAYEIAITDFAGPEKILPAKLPPRVVDGLGGSNVLSSSPEMLRSPSKSTSNLANAFAASLSRPFSLSASTSSSPPTSIPKKRISPIGSLTALQGYSLPFGGRDATEQSIKELDSSKTNVLRGGKNKEQSQGMTADAASSKQMKINLKNQDQFELDGYSNNAILDATKEWSHTCWRAAYADMLTAWQLPIKRAEISNSVGAVYSKNHPRIDGANPDNVNLIIGNKKSLLPVSRVDTLKLSTHCQVCSSVQYRTRLKQEICSNCGSPKSNLITCALCNELIYGRALPCFTCGHVMHVACRTAWLQETSSSAAEEKEVDHASCPTGCGCACSVHEQSGNIPFEYLDAEDERHLVAPPASPAPSTIRDMRDDEATIPHSRLYLTQPHETPGRMLMRTDTASSHQTQHSLHSQHSHHSQGSRSSKFPHTPSFSSFHKSPHSLSQPSPYGGSRQFEDIGEADSAWEHVAYQSLARNLGDFGVGGGGPSGASGTGTPSGGMIKHSKSQVFPSVTGKKSRVIRGASMGGSATGPDGLGGGSERLLGPGGFEV